MGLIHSPIVPSDGLVLCLDTANKRSYPGSGTNWFDLSGNNNHGVLTNGPTLNTGPGGGMSFDGVNDYVVMSSPVLTRPQSVPTTISYWVRPTDLSGYRTIAATYNEVNGWQTNLEPTTGRPGFSWVVAPNFIGLRSTTSLPVNSWSHVCIRYDGTDKNGLSFFVNGIGPTATIDESITASLAEVNTATMSIGARPMVDLRHIGQLDDIRIYNRALSASEIRQLFEFKRRRYS